MIDVALIHPEIPGNTGNAGRLCVGLNVPLHLVKPIGFQIDDKAVRRAGLDYWHLIQLHVHDSLELFLEAMGQRRLWYFSTHAETVYSGIEFQSGDVMCFGSETKGLPAEIFERFPNQMLRIPSGDGVRSLNLSNAAAVAVYEAHRQLGWPQQTVVTAAPVEAP